MSTFDWSKFNVTDARTDGSKASINHNLDRLYSNVVGRNADPSGRDYWAEQISSGKSTYDTVLSGLTASDEYKDRNIAVQSNPNITEAELDSLSSAYKSGLLDTAVFNNDGSIQPDPSIATNNKVTITPSTGGGDGPQQDTTANTNTNTTTNTNTDTAATAAVSSGLNLDDLNSWWDTKQSKQTDKFDQFTEFMGLLSGMGGMFGGSNVPGFASGGVAAASPYNNFMGFMNAFKSLGGGSQQADITTGNIN